MRVSERNVRVVGVRRFLHALCSFLESPEYLRSVKQIKKRVYQVLRTKGIWGPGEKKNEGIREGEETRENRQAQKDKKVPKDAGLPPQTRFWGKTNIHKYTLFHSTTEH